MSAESLKLQNAPIVEAIVDLDCDMPPQFQVDALQKTAGDRLSTDYPKLRLQFVEEHRFEKVPSPLSHRRGMPP